MTKTDSYLHITGGIGAALLPFAFPWLSPVYGLIIMALGVLAEGRKHFRFAPLLLFAVFTDWQWLSTTWSCLLYTSPSPRDLSTSRMPSSA